MVQGKKIRNVAWTRSDKQVKDILKELMANVYKKIDTRNMIEDIVRDIVDKAMGTSDAITPAIRRIRQERIDQVLQLAETSKATALKAAAAARFDLLVMKYRREPKVLITNLMNGQEYTVSMKPEDIYKLSEVGYKTNSIIHGTTKHLYGALRATMADLKRSTSLRIWYFGDDKDCVTVESDDWTPVTRMIDRKLYVTKLWDTIGRVASENEADKWEDQATMHNP